MVVRMKALLALLLLATPASAEVWTEFCGRHVLTSLPGGVFVLESRDDGSKVTCKLWPVQSRLPVQYLGCDNDKEVTMAVLGSIVLFDGIDLRPDGEQP